MIVTANPTRARPGWYHTAQQLVLSVVADARHTYDRPRVDCRHVVPGRFRVKAVNGCYCTLQTMEGDAPVEITEDRECGPKTYRTTGGRPRGWGPSW